MTWQNVLFSDKESTNNIIENKITVRNCEVEKVRTGLEIHMPTCYVQEHKNGQNFSPNQNLKDICSQGLYSFICTGKHLHDSTQLYFREILNFQIYGLFCHSLKR